MFHTPILQEEIYKLVEWSNKWEMNFNVDKCSVMHIGHNNMQDNYDMSNQQLPTTDQQRDVKGMHHQRPHSGKNKPRRKGCKIANRMLEYIAEISGSETKN